MPPTERCGPRHGRLLIRVSCVDGCRQRGAAKSLDEALGFSLSVEESSVPNAGQGVRLNGKTSIGSLVVLYRSSQEHVIQIRATRV